MRSMADADASSKPGLAEQVGAGVSGDAELREHDDVAVGALSQHPDDLRGVGRRVGHRGPDRDARDAGKAVRIHGSVSLDVAGTGRRTAGPRGSPAIVPGRPIDRPQPSRVEQVTIRINGPPGRPGSHLSPGADLGHGLIAFVPRIRPGIRLHPSILSGPIMSNPFRWYQHRSLHPPRGGRDRVGPPGRRPGRRRRPRRGGRSPSPALRESPSGCAPPTSSTSRPS